MSFDLVWRWRLVLMAAGLAVAAPMPAQVAAAGASAPAFDVVSIKPNKSGDGRMMIRQGQDDYAGTNITLKMMLRFAYDLKTEDQISGLTGAVDSARFDVQAKVDDEAVEALKKLPKEESAAERRTMMQAMLADRFKLKAHHEVKELGMYDLVIAKGGFKLKDADPNDSYANGIKGMDGKAHAGMMMMNNGKLTAQAVPIANVANFLAQTLHKQVMDKTGLTGKYDITLQWRSDEGPESHEAAGADAAPSIFTALQEQLGLRLEPVKGPVDTIVVDHVEMPSEN
jgi:uncharacterized protein (TIGR03435 family)